MSLLLDALKKAEQAKQAAARAAPDPDATMPGGRAAPPLMTRDRLPDIAGLELVPDDLAPPPRQSAAPQRPAGPSEPPPPQLQLAEDRPPAAAPSGAQTRRTETRRVAGRPAEEVAADRQAARQVFEAKQMDYNPKRGYYATLGLLGLIGLGVGGYFWWQLQPKSNFVVANAPPPPPSASATAPPQTPPAVAAPSAGPAAPPPAAAGAPVTPTVAAAAPAPPPSPASAVGVQREPAAAAPPDAVVMTGPRSPPVRPSPTARGEVPTPPQPMASAAPRPRPATTGAEAAPPPERRAPMAIVPTRALDRELDAAYTAFEAGDYAAARRSYQQVLRADPANRDALLGLAAIDLRAGDPNAAEARYQKLIERDPRDPYAQAAMTGLRPTADPVQSESRLKTLISQQPDSAPLQFALGNLYMGQSRWSEAQAAYFRAYSADPDNADFAYNLAVSLDHLRQPRLALEYYQRALALADQRPTAFDRSRAAARARDLER